MAEKTKQKTSDAKMDVARLAEILTRAEHISRRRLYIENLIRGIMFGAGGVIGATLLIALVVWILSLFGEIPLIGPLFDETKQTIQEGQNGR